MQSFPIKSGIFIITGMHRSGTSLAAALLQSAGVDIGHRLLPPAQGNIKGYFEDLDFVEFHENILSAQGISKAGWTLADNIQVPEQFLERARTLIYHHNSTEHLWGWKDPRTTLFLNFWKSLIPDGIFLLIYRTPWDVIDSLYRRRNLGDEIFDSNPNFALNTWLNYNKKIINFYDDFSDQCILCSMAHIAKEPNILVTAIKEKFGIDLNFPASDIYDNSLLSKHSFSSHRPTLIQHYFPTAWELYQELNVRALTPNGLTRRCCPETLQLPPYKAWVLQDWLNVRKLQNQVEQTQRELASCHTQLQQLNSFHTQLQQTQTELKCLQSQLTQTQIRLQNAQTTVIAMESSKFWKIRTFWFRLRRNLGVSDQASFSINRLGSKIKHLLYVLKNKGWHYAIARISKKIYLKLDNGLTSYEVLPDSYQRWLQQNFPRESDLRKMAETVDIFPYKPIISVIMPTFNTSEPFLRDAIKSVINQVYPYWELCIADDASTQSQTKKVLEEYAAQDPRIKVIFRKTNGHISNASNSALEMATGEFITLLDHDDLLTPDALYEIVLLLNRHPEADMIYSDEDKIDEKNQFIAPFFKQDWCPDSFLSRMYTCHLGTYRRSLIQEIGGFRAGYEGSQDYDLVLRLTEKTEKIFHIPKILYHWRIHPQSAASGSEAKPYAYKAGEKALADALYRRNEKGRILEVPGFPGVYRIRYHIKDYKRVSIIIPTKDLGETLDRCLKSIFQESLYSNYEVIVIDNGSTEEDTAKVIDYWQTQEPTRFRAYKLDIPFNFSKINNYAVTQTTGDYLLFLNNDTEVVTPDWIDAMVEQAQRPSIGAVGALLQYPDKTVQHAGIVLGVCGIANHSHKHLTSVLPGYASQLITINNYSAITGACLMCRRELYEEVGGFEEKLAVAYNDVDFCLKLIDKGYRNVYLPHVILYHHESKSRGAEDTPEKLARLAKEADYVQKKWNKLIENDPCYSPNLTKNRTDYSLNI
jgi:GT2 family glycosyltransferase